MELMCHGVDEFFVFLECFVGVVVFLGNFFFLFGYDVF